MQIDRNKIFISHAHENKPFVRQLERELNGIGAEVWVDHSDVLAGDVLRERIEEGLKWCKALLLIWSKAAAESPYVRYEWTTALYLNKRVIPCLLDDTKPDETLAELLYIDLQSEAGFAKLRRDKKSVQLLSSDETEDWDTRLREALRNALPPIENLPRYQHRLFVGREQLLRELRSAFESKHIQALHGLGGVGKTQLALEYAIRHFNEYEVIFWLDAKNIATNFEQLAATPLKLPESNKKEREVIKEAVLRWLEQNISWLIIFDDAKKMEDLQPYLPKNTNGHVLITSRNPNWRSIAGTLKVPVMEPQEAVDLLCQRTGQSDTSAAQILAEALGFLPLALKHTGAYIEKVGYSFTAYLRDYQECRLELFKQNLPQHDNIENDYYHTVATTWELSFRQVQENSLNGVDLLNLCAFLESKAIPTELLREGIVEVSKTRTLAISNRPAFNNAIMFAREFSLLDVEDDALAMHPFVQMVNRDRLAEVERKYWAEIALRVVNHVFPFQSNDIKAWPTCAALLPHAQTVIEHAKELTNIQPEIARLLNQMGMYLRVRAEYAEAESSLRHCVSILEKQFGLENDEVAICLNNLGGVLEEEGKYVEAESLYRRSLKIGEKQWGSEHPKVIFRLNNLAGLLVLQGRYDEAEPIYRRSLAILDKQLVPDIDLVATCLNNLAGLHEAQGKYAEAESLYRRSLAIWEKELGSNHPSVAINLNNLALSLLFQGKYAEAETLFQRSLAIDEKTYGDDHPNIAVTLNNLGNVLKSQGKYAEAETQFRRSLEIAEKKLDLGHPQIATSLNSLATLLYEQGKYSEAEQFYRRCLEILEKRLGPEHPNFAASLGNLGLVLKAQGKFTEAEPPLRRSLEIAEKRFGAEHPQVASHLSNLAELFRAQGKYHEAEQLVHRSLRIDEKKLGPDHPQVATDLYNLAGLFHDQEKYDEAEPLYQRCLRIREEYLEPDHPHFAETLNNFGELLRVQGRNAEAEPLLHRSLTIDEKLFGPESLAVANGLNNLGLLFVAQGKYVEAETHLRRSLTIREKLFGSESFEIAHALKILAEFLQMQGRWSEAVSLYRRNLAINESQFGSQHPAVAADLHNVAVMLSAQEKFTEAEPLFLRSLAIRENHLGPEHRDVASSLNKLAALFYQQGLYDKAEPLCQRNLKIIGHFS